MLYNKIMRKKTLTLIVLLISAYFTLPLPASGPEDLIKISVNIEPGKIKQGNEGVMKIRIVPNPYIKISSHPKFMIRLDENRNLSFPKLFFTASELDFKTKQEKNSTYLELEKDIDIRFKVNPDSLLGKQFIRGEVIFTAVFKDNWSVKTYQRFQVDFTSQRNRKLRTKKRK